MTVVVLALGYLLGSLPTGLLVVRALTGQDIRAAGSGNIGTVNVYRVAGLWASILVLAVDMLKGAVPGILARMWGQPAETQGAGGLPPIAGHTWHRFLRFGGGTGHRAPSGGCVCVAPPGAAGNGRSRHARSRDRDVYGGLHPGGLRGRTPPGRTHRGAVLRGAGGAAGRCGLGEAAAFRRAAGGRAVAARESPRQ